MVERLVAEVAMRVDGTPHVRVHGRSGQDQEGLDLWGGPVDSRTVYQVKRLQRLTAGDLRQFVVEYAGPPRRPGEALLQPRRFEARRFVLATSYVVEDTATDIGLDALQQEYEGDLKVELWDGSELSRMLRERGPLVAGIFGPDWARVFCGYHPPAGSVIPSGRALLNDPVIAHGLGDLRDRAATLANTDPAGAARQYAVLARELDGAGRAAAARSMRRRQRDLHSSAGEVDAAVALTVELLVEANEQGDRAVSDVGPFSPLGRLTGDTPPVTGIDVPESVDWTGGNPLNVPAATAATAITCWADEGFDLAPVTAALRSLADGGYRLAPALALAVAEQVIADDEPTDDIDPLRAVLADLLPSQPGGLQRVRLECAAADLDLKAGCDHDRTLRYLETRARNGTILGPGDAALALRRAAYGHAIAGRIEDAVNCYQEAVREATDALLGGDARDSLRSIRFLTDDVAVQAQLSTAAAETGNRARLLPGADQAALGVLEHLADDHKHAALANAAYEARSWRRIERASGALVEEIIAHRRHGQVLRSAGEAAAAVVPFIRGRERDLARECAHDAPWTDITGFLTDGPTWTHRAACAVAAAQADFVPDDQLAALADALVRVVEHGSVGPSEDALAALAALRERIPSAVARRILAVLRPFFIDRPRGYGSRGDQEALTALRAVGRHPNPEIADEAAEQLLAALRAEVHAAQDYLGDLPPVRVEEVEDVADEGIAAAVTVLSRWELPGPAVRAAARIGAARSSSTRLVPETCSTGAAPRRSTCLPCAALSTTRVRTTRPQVSDRTAINFRPRWLRFGTALSTTSLRGPRTARTSPKAASQRSLPCASCATESHLSTEVQSTAGYLPSRTIRTCQPATSSTRHPPIR